MLGKDDISLPLIPIECTIVNQLEELFSEPIKFLEMDFIKNQQKTSELKIKKKTAMVVLHQLIWQQS